MLFLEEQGYKRKNDKPPTFPHEPSLFRGVSSVKIQNRKKENVTFFRFGVCVGKPLIDCGLREGPPSCALYTQARGIGTDRSLVHGLYGMESVMCGSISRDAERKQKKIVIHFFWKIESNKKSLLPRLQLSRDTDCTEGCSSELINERNRSGHQQVLYLFSVL